MSLEMNVRVADEPFQALELHGKHESEHTEHYCIS